MGRPKRAEQFRHDEVTIVHVMQRCVRRAFLAGTDFATGRDYSYRREWIRRRMELLASVYGIDLLTYAVMSNHLHIIVRTRPDVVKAWSDEEVAYRWLQLFPGKRLEEHLGEPSEAAMAMLLASPGKLATLRRRLSDVSWFMKCLSEPIARQANKQDECTGRFWEGRFRAQKIVDEAALLACTLYVDLNPVRAALAETPEESEFTAAYDRIGALKGAKARPAACEVPDSDSDRDGALQPDSSAEAGELSARERREKQRLQRALLAMRQRRAEQLRRHRKDAWLAPVELNERGRPGPKDNQEGLRASNKGFLPLSIKRYLKLLDFVGREGRGDKRGQIPVLLEPILKRIGIEPSMFSDLVWEFQRYFRNSRAAGRPDSLKQEAKDSHRSWIPGQKRAAECFIG